MAAKANRLLGLFRNSLATRDSKTWTLIYKVNIIPQIEFANSAWSPYRAKDKKVLEKIQRRTTKIVHELRGLPYEERCKRLGLTNLAERRLRGDMIQQFKIFHAMDELYWVVSPAISKAKGSHR